MDHNHIHNNRIPEVLAYPNCDGSLHFSIDCDCVEACSLHFSINCVCVEGGSLHLSLYHYRTVYRGQLEDNDDNVTGILRTICFCLDLLVYDNATTLHTICLDLLVYDNCHSNCNLLAKLAGRDLLCLGEAASL